MTHAVPSYPRLTKIMRKVLQQAVDDGGEVDLSGMDKHPGWGQREITAAQTLSNGPYSMGRGNYWLYNGRQTFTINARGREALK